MIIFCARVVINFAWISCFSEIILCMYGGLSDGLAVYSIFRHCRSVIKLLGVSEDSILLEILCYLCGNLK